MITINGENIMITNPANVNHAALKFVLECLDRGGYINDPKAEDRIQNVFYEGTTSTGKLRYRIRFWNPDHDVNPDGGWDAGWVYVDPETLKADY